MGDAAASVTGDMTLEQPGQALALIGIDPSLLTGIDPLKKMPV
jgi:hypothetical protein